MRKWLSAFLLLALVAAGYWGYWEHSRRMALSYALEADYQREFYDLVTNMEQTEVLLNKSLASASPKHNILYLTEVWNRSFTAQSSMAQLPFKDINLSASRKFLAQLGDFSYSMAKKEANGETISADEEKTLSGLAGSVASFNKNLRQIEQKMAGSNFRWSDNLGRTPRPKVAEAVAGMDALAESNELNGFLDIDKRMQQLPSMVYDGPFSDHLQERKPQGLGGRKISEEEAARQASAFLDIPGVRNFQTSGKQEVKGKIPAFGFTLQKKGTPGAAVLNIAERGGNLLWMLYNRPVGKPAIEVAAARVKALEYLKKIGFDSVRPTYTLREDNVQVFTFAAVDGDVLLYSDQLKVQVALDNGQVVGFDGVSYYTNHRSRNLPKPEISRQMAESKVRKDLKVETSRLALIPLDAGDEVLTWEFKTTKDNKVFLVYINALDGAEEKILQLIDAPHGELAM